MSFAGFDPIAFAVASPAGAMPGSAIDKIALHQHINDFDLGRDQVEKVLPPCGADHPSAELLRLVHNRFVREVVRELNHD